MNRPTRLRVAGAAAAVAALAIAGATSAAAAPDRDVSDVTYPIELGYDNLVTGSTADYVAFVGAPGEDWCGAGPMGPEVDLRVQSYGEGADRYWFTGRTYAEVYEYAGGGLFDLVGDYCANGFPEPYASGTGVLKVRGSSTYFADIDRSPEGWYRDSFAGEASPAELDRAEANWFRGALRTQEGDTVHVTAHAEVSTFYGPPDAVSVTLRGGRP